ncbi:hypothetical protein CL621_03500 [archaeon]|nr:hypothetical protein [archaeon]|tara:strand:+ start:3048 stop:3596 length:549 start_codon:yes stop_codon:yes gene_type:complete
MGWISVRENDILEITRKTIDGEEFLRKQYYDRKEKISEIPLVLRNSDIEITVKPYNLERLENEVNEEYEDKLVNKLVVGIRNKEYIDYIGKSWISKQTNDENYIQYYFENDQPRNHYNSGGFVLGWPDDRPIVIDNKLNRYFETLMSLRPGVVGSLNLCLTWLAAPGSEYGKVKVIPFQLKK